MADTERETIRDAAVSEYGEDGRIEIDENAEISEVTGGGDDDHRCVRDRSLAAVFPRGHGDDQTSGEGRRRQGEGGAGPATGR